MIRASIVLFLAMAAAADKPPADKTLVDLGATFDQSLAVGHDARCEHGEGLLRITLGHKDRWPGVTLKAPGGHWDLAAYATVAVTVKNVGTQAAVLHCRVDNPGADGSKHCVTGQADLPPSATRTITVPINRVMPAALRGKLFGMRGYPNQWTESQQFDPAEVTQLLLFVARPQDDTAFEVSAIRACGAAAGGDVDAAKFFPMIDQFGQYRHKDWPGNVQSLDDLAQRRTAEADELTAHPGPSDWDQYGGWQSGPQLKATGFFHTEKVDGRWWLVDPAGRLFWSHGVDCVGDGNAVTPITDRVFYFADLPAKDSPLAAFYGKGNWAPHGYYQGKSGYETFNFTAANLTRKYGAGWQKQYAEVAQQRLRSWGLNSIANWSRPEVYQLRKTPYTATVGVRGKTRPIEGSSGYWAKFTDVFDPAFAAGLRRAMEREQGHSAGDPWCLGYFVDNELSWGDEYSLALAALASPADQPAKRVFIDDLKQKYTTVARLNAAWDTQHASWEALLQSTATPDKKKAADDLGAFYTKLAERYFEICRDAVKAVAPQQLYLGCRFAWTNDRAVRAGAKYCDVVSFNRYQRSVAELKLPAGCDKPLVIGEFHFGALDRGMFHTGLVPTASQAERAAAYAAYVRSALDNPALVGTHWFQYGDQATTGRPDGENYQIGLVDVCDTPYPETIAAVREVGSELYRRHAGK